MPVSSKTGCTNGIAGSSPKLGEIRNPYAPEYETARSGSAKTCGTRAFIWQTSRPAVKPTPTCRFATAHASAHSHAVHARRVLSRSGPEINS